MRTPAVLLSLLLTTVIPVAGSEVGPNDFRISVMGTDGDTSDRGELPRSAYNATANEFLVVWLGRVGAETEVWAQRINASTMTEIGDQFVISDVGPPGNSAFAAGFPAVAWNSTNNEYLVVWAADDGSGTMIDGEFEIWGQRLSATGAEIGTNDFRISDMGTTDGSTASIGRNPDVVYNATSNEYLVVWDGQDDDVALDESEIWGQRINAMTGAEVGTNDFRISNAGAAMDTTVLAGSARAAWNSTNNEYLVVWSADSLATDNENEIFGQRLSSTGGFSGSEFRISDMGPDGNADYDGSLPAVAYNSSANEYLVVWLGDDNTNPLVDGENEVFGQRISNTGGALGVNDFRISDMGPNGDVDYDAANPDVSYSASLNEYLVVWTGDDTTNTEFEVFGQRIDAVGSEVGTNDFRLSDMGSTDGDPTYGAFRAMAKHGAAGLVLVVWNGDDDAGMLADQEIEVYGQFYRLAVDPNGDFNADGNADILWRNYSNGANAIWYMDDAAFVNAASLQGTGDTNWRIVGTGDFDADGDLDIVWRHTVDGGNAVWFLDGANVTGAAQLPGVTNPNWKIVAVADFDLDGDPDILWRNISSFDTAVWIMDGTSFSTAVTLPGVADPNWTIEGAADMNGDSGTDIIWRNYGTGANAIWLMDGTSYMSSASLPGILDLNWRMEAFADYDGDGSTDIVWRHYGGGDVAYWYMNGTSYSSSAGLPGVGDPNWQIVAP